MRLITLVALALLTACASACASVVSGDGTLAAPVSTPAASASSTAPPSSLPASSPSASSVPASSAPATTGSCPDDADFCDDFSSAGSGWSVGNEPRYYSSYAKYLGGTYRMGERTSSAKTQLAPFD